MGSVGIPLQDRLQLCLEVAHELCKGSTQYVDEVRVNSGSKRDGYLRAIYTFADGRLAAERVVAAQISDVGALLREPLRSRTAGLDPSTSAPCWLTVQLPDGCSLRHVLFGIDASTREPQQMMSEIALGTRKRAAQQQQQSGVQSSSKKVHKQSAPPSNHSGAHPREEDAAGQQSIRSSQREAVSPAERERTGHYQHHQEQREHYLEEEGEEPTPTSQGGGYGAGIDQASAAAASDSFAQEKEEEEEEDSCGSGGSSRRHDGSQQRPRSTRSGSRQYVERAPVFSADGMQNRSRRNGSEYVMPPHGKEAELVMPNEDGQQWPDSVHRTGYFVLRDELWELADDSITRRLMIEDKSDQGSDQGSEY